MHKRISVISGITIFVLLLLCAGFVGGKLLNGQGLHSPGGTGFNFGSGSSDKTQGCDVHRLVAPQLPGPPMMRRSVLVRRQNNSIFVGVPSRDVNVNSNSTVSQTDSFEGPLVEIVVSHDTKIFHDVTFQSYNGSCGQVQQVLEPGKMNDIVDDTTLLIWGEQNGERVIASYLVYDLPLVTKPAAGK